MKKTKLGEHEQSCWDELVMLDIDESKVRSLCKKARKLDEDGVSFPLHNERTFLPHEGYYSEIQDS